jgi:hypothetical protein
VFRFAVDPSGTPLRLAPHHLIALIPFAAFAWMLGAEPLWLLVQAVAPQANMSFTTAIGIQTIAAVAGGVTFFMPNGLGVRDGTVVALLAGIAGVPLPAAVAAALLVRVSDPVAKAIIVMLIAALGRIPVFALPSTALGRAQSTTVRAAA